MCIFPWRVYLWDGESRNTECTGTSREIALFNLFFLPFFSGSGDLSCREMLSLAALVMSCSSSVALHDVTDAVSCVTSRLNHWREEVLVGETSGHV